MKISFYYNKNHPDRLPTNNLKYGDPSPLEIHDLKEIIANCVMIDDNTPKGHSGQIYAFIADRFYNKEYIVDNYIRTDGALFCDIDDLTDIEREAIKSAMKDISKRLKNLYCWWESKNRNLHVCFWTEQLDAREYAIQEMTALLCFAWTVREVTGLTLSDKEDHKQIDTHNKSISQRFFLNKVWEDRCGFFDDCEPTNFEELTKEQLGKLKSFWPNIVRGLNEIINEDKTRKVYATNSTYTATTVNEDKIEYIGHTTRWQVYTTLQYIFKTKEATDSEWAKFVKRLPEKKTKSGAIEHDIFFYTNEPEHNKWFDKYDEKYINIKRLESYGYEISKLVNGLTLEKDEYITKYANEIWKEIEANDRTEWNAPTGSGKTTLINGNDKYDKDGLAARLNAVVIVPFNVTNNLYNNCTEISTATSNKICDGPMVMVWDQACIHWPEIYDRNIIIDEAHTLFLDRTYRDAAIRLMCFLREKTHGKVVLFTATPCWEAKLLGAKQIEISKKRSTIKCDFVETDLIERHQINLIKKCYDNGIYDKIILFDDMTAKKIYENLVCDGYNVWDICYLRSERKKTEDFTRLLETEKLEKKIIISTCVAFNGLNFINENERILVVTSFRKGYTTAALIAQEAGRVRRSEVKVTCFYDGLYNEGDIDEQKLYAATMKEWEVSGTLTRKLASYDDKYADEKWLDAKDSIDRYMEENSNIDAVTSQLADMGYFDITVKEMTEERNRVPRLTLKLKKQESDSFIEDFKNDEWRTSNYEENSYKDKWRKEIEYILNDPYITGISKDTFIDLIDNKDKKNLIETTIGQVREIVDIMKIEDTQWGLFIGNIDVITNDIADKVNPLKAKQWNSKAKHFCEVRDKYKGKVTYENGKIDFTEAVNDVIKWEYDNYMKIKEKMKENGAKGGKKRREKVRIIKDIDKYGIKKGEIYDSMKSLSQAANVKQCTVSYWYKIGYLEKI